jgi:hypothetical protein
MEEPVYRVYPFPAQGYQEKGTPEAGEGSQEGVDPYLRLCACRRPPKFADCLSYLTVQACNTTDI